MSNNNNKDSWFEQFRGEKTQVDLKKCQSKHLIATFKNLTPEEKAQLGLPCSTYYHTGGGYYGGGHMITVGGSGSTSIGWRSGGGGFGGHSLTPQ